MCFSREVHTFLQSCNLATLQDAFPYMAGVLPNYNIIYILY